MERSGGRLYSGPLSRAAQKILAVLRAQSDSSNNHRQMERYYGSQREPCAQSSRSMSQEERKDRHTDGPQVSSSSTSHRDSSTERQRSQASARYQCSQTADGSLSCRASSCWESSVQRQKPQTEAFYQRSQTYSHRTCRAAPAYRSSRAPSFAQREVSETPACFSRRDRHTPSLRIPERLSERQSGTSAEGIRPSFICSLSPDEVLFPTVEHPNTHKEEPGLACQPLSSCLSVSVEAHNGTSGALKEKKDTEGRNILTHEVEEAVASDGRLKWKRPLSDSSAEASNGRADTGIPYQHSESETTKTGRIPPSGFETRQETSCDARSPKLMRPLHVELRLDSENMSEAGTGQMSDGENRMHNGANGVKYKEAAQMDAVLPNKTGSLGEMERFLLLGTTEITDSGRNLDLASITSNTDKSFHCYSEAANSRQRRDNDPEVKAVEHPPGIEIKVMPVGYHTCSPKNISVSLERGGPCQAENPQVSAQTVTEGAPVQREPTKLVLGDTAADHLGSTGAEERAGVMEVGLEVETRSRTKAGIHTGAGDKMETEQPHCSDVQLRDRQREAGCGEAEELPRRGRGRPPLDREDGNASTGDSWRDRCPTPTLSEECGARGSGPRISGNQTANRRISGSSSGTVPAPESTLATGQNSPTVQAVASPPSKQMESNNLLAFQTHLHQPPLIPSFPLKRRHEALRQNADTRPKISLAGRPPKWVPPRSTQERAREEVSSNETGPVLGVNTHPYVQTRTQQKCSRMEEMRHESAEPVTCKSPEHKRVRFGPDRDTNGPKTSHERAQTGEPRSKAGSPTETLTSDPRVKDPGKLSADEKMQMLEKAGRAETLVLTMVHQDGTTQLDPEQKLSPPVCGLLVLMKNDLDRSPPQDSLGPNDGLVYLKLDQTPAWAQQHTHRSPEHFTRDMLLQVLSRSQLVVCYKAKDLLRTALQLYKQDLSWKQVAGCRIQDPQVSGWLLDPADPSSCYQDLLHKHCKRPRAAPALGTKKVSQVISGLSSLYWLHMELCSKLQSQGLWELYSDMELNMIPVLAAMESHRIHVDKEALKRTSELLGSKMKQLEQEAHRAAGQIFLLTSNTQLRTVLFEKLRLHERCENKKLPKTVNKQQQSTSEAALLQLQDLHPLPKIILEYRQIHKIKSTFVDGILSCMMSKNCISSTWCQTSVVTGRISAKHPNFQALPRQPLQVTKKQYIQGKEEEEEEEVVTVHPRASFIPQKGCTFLAADFCQVELRLLAHLSSDPELLRIFTNPQADVFTMLASQWKGVSEGEVSSEDREHAKRIVYSVVYGAGRERLSGILGVSADQASQFQDSFLQTYREVQAFIQRTIQLCHRQGYVLSIMGRRRTLPNISSPDWGVRMQAERQAVNFVVQGSAADLCKMATIRIHHLVSCSTSLSARLVAQLHDELLYEVEDSQVEHFAALVKSTMESLQHIDRLGVRLKVPLKVAVSSGKSWGSMSELHIPPASPSPSL